MIDKVLIGLLMLIIILYFSFLAFLLCEKLSAKRYHQEESIDSSDDTNK